MMIAATLKGVPGLHPVSIQVLLPKETRPEGATVVDLRTFSDYGRMVDLIRSLLERHGDKLTDDGEAKPEIVVLELPSDLCRRDRLNEACREILGGIHEFRMGQSDETTSIRSVIIIVPDHEFYRAFYVTFQELGEEVIEGLQVKVTSSDGLTHCTVKGVSAGWLRSIAEKVETPEKHDFWLTFDESFPERVQISFFRVDGEIDSPAGCVLRGRIESGSSIHFHQMFELRWQTDPKDPHCSTTVAATLNGNMA